jgi:hypothetical protein
MSQFTVRIELHDAKWEDYDVLHAAMEERGFSRLITADDGQTYHLPWAEYTGAGNLNSGQVRDIARSAADSTGQGGMRSSLPNQVAEPGSALRSLASRRKGTQQP